MFSFSHSLSLFASHIYIFFTHYNHTEYMIFKLDFKILSFQYPNVPGGWYPLV